MAVLGLGKASGIKGSSDCILISPIPVNIRGDGNSSSRLDAGIAFKSQAGGGKMRTTAGRSPAVVLILGNGR